MNILRPAALLVLASLALAVQAQIAVSSTLDLAVSAEANLADGTIATDSVARAHGAALDELVGSLFVSDSTPPMARPPRPLTPTLAGSTPSKAP